MSNWNYDNKNKCWYFKDGGSLKQEYINSLDSWIKNNPTFKGINTKNFRDFFIEIVGMESNYKPDAVSLNSDGTKGSFTGWYQTKGDSNRSADKQHRDAFNHLYNLFKSSITKLDIDTAKKKGISQAQLLAKYWNQQNRVTNYIHRGIDDQDGAGSKISEYGNNINLNLDYYNLVPDAITSDYVILKKGESVGTYAPFVRNDNINYSDKEQSIYDMNEGRVLWESKDKQRKREFPNVWPGDTLYVNSEDSFLDKLTKVLSNIFKQSNE